MITKCQNHTHLLKTLDLVVNYITCSVPLLFIKPLTYIVAVRVIHFVNSYRLILECLFCYTKQF